MKTTVLLTVRFTMLCCVLFTSCISEEIVIEKYNSNSAFYSNRIGPFKNLLFLVREDGLDLSRLKNFEAALKAKCAKHGASILFAHYKNDDSASFGGIRQAQTSNKAEFVIRIFHSGGFMRKTMQDPFVGMKQKSPFRVESLRFTTMGFDATSHSKPLWKGSFSVTGASKPAADEQAVTALYKRLLKDGILPQ